MWSGAVKESVSDLEKRVEVMARVAEQEGRLTDKGVAIYIEPTRDVVNEIDAEFGTANGSAPTKTDKSL